MATRTTAARAISVPCAVSGDEIFNHLILYIPAAERQECFFGSWCLMAQYKHLPIYKGTYDFLLRLMTATKDFPREHKYTLGQKLRDEALLMVLLIYRANSSTDRTIHIMAILEGIQTVNVMLRLAHDMRVLSRGHYAGLAEMTDSLARQAQGWIKSSGRKKPEQA